MTDREIIDYIKRDLVEGNTGNNLVFLVENANGSDEVSSRYADEFFQTMFDHSMMKVVYGLAPMRDGNGWDIKSYNGRPNPIYGYEFMLKDSEDFQTNITPKLMKFIEAMVVPGMVERLAYPMGKPKEVRLVEYGCGCPVALPPEDPWDALERYLREGEETSSNG